jgi:hypothetical protein
MHFQDLHARPIRLSDERLDHLEATHPEMVGQIVRIEETLGKPERIVRSQSDSAVELYYKLYPETPVTTRHMCVVVKVAPPDAFIVTAYYTDAVKKGEVLWER